MKGNGEVGCSREPWPVAPGAQPPQALQAAYPLLTVPAHGDLPRGGSAGPLCGRWSSPALACTTQGMAPLVLLPGQGCTSTALLPALPTSSPAAPTSSGFSDLRDTLVQRPRQLHLRLQLGRGSCPRHSPGPVAPPERLLPCPLPWGEQPRRQGLLWLVCTAPGAWCRAQATPRAHRVDNGRQSRHRCCCLCTGHHPEAGLKDLRAEVRRGRGSPDSWGHDCFHCLCTVTAAQGWPRGYVMMSRPASEAAQGSCDELQQPASSGSALASAGPPGHPASFLAAQPR